MQSDMDDTSQLPPGAERRALPRLPTTLRGKVFPGALDCIIKDYNERGAKVQVVDGLPSDGPLILVVWSTGLAFEGQVRWRSGEDIGLRFSKGCDFRGRVPAKFWEAREEWLKSRPKMPRRALMSQSAMIERQAGRSTAAASPSYLARLRG
jgi:hypothetical protein